MAAARFLDPELYLRSLVGVPFTLQAASRVPSYAQDLVLGGDTPRESCLGIFSLFIRGFLSFRRGKYTDAYLTPWYLFELMEHSCSCACVYYPLRMVELRAQIGRWNTAQLFYFSWKSSVVVLSHQSCCKVAYCSLSTNGDMPSTQPPRYLSV